MRLGESCGAGGAPGRCRPAACNDGLEAHHYWKRRRGWRGARGGMPSLPGSWSGLSYLEARREPRPTWGGLTYLEARREPRSTWGGLACCEAGASPHMQATIDRGLVLGEAEVKAEHS